MSASPSYPSYASYEISKHPDPCIGVECKFERDRIGIHVSGNWHYYKLALLFEGGYNRVYTLSAMTGAGVLPVPDVLFRIAIVDAKYTREQRYEEHYRELKSGVRLASQGICPKIFMNLIVDIGSEITYGTAIERYDCSLADVQMCPRLMREVFVERDGESLLVDLYTRAGATTRCIDTKPANVVVRLPSANHGHHGLSFALIDVDPVFCGEAVPAPGRSSIMLALSSFLHGEGASAPLSDSALAVATMSTLAHVTNAALDYTIYDRGLGFPYIHITDLLLQKWTTVTQILNTDRYTMDGRRRMASSQSVWDRLRSYWNANKPWNFSDLSDPYQIYHFLSIVIGRRESRILLTCTAQRKASLYEKIIVLTLGYTREDYESKLRDLNMSEGVAAWEAMTHKETVVLASTACGIGTCTFHTRHSGH